MHRGSERLSWQVASEALRSARFRLAPGRGAVVAVLVLAVVVIAISGGWVLASRPARLAAAGLNKPIAAASVSPGGSLASPRSGPAGVTAPPPSGSSTSSQLVVDVVGKVRRPGVYHLPSGSRVVDAVRMAGGATPGTDLTSTNLARKVADGEQIGIGVAVQAGATPGGLAAPGAGAGPGGGQSGAATAQAPLDLNSATEAQLDALPGVGPVLAQHILEWRAAHGRFDSVNQLNSVSGIGDAKYADLSSMVSVG